VSTCEEVHLSTSGRLRSPSTAPYTHRYGAVLVGDADAPCRGAGAGITAGPPSGIPPVVRN